MSQVGESQPFSRSVHFLAQQYFIHDNREALLMYAHRYDFDILFFDQIADFLMASEEAGSADLFVVDLDVLYNLQASNNRTPFLGDLLRQLPQIHQYVYLQTRRQSERFLLQRMLVETNCLAYAEKPIANDVLIDKLFSLLFDHQIHSTDQMVYLGDCGLLDVAMLTRKGIHWVHHDDPHTLHRYVREHPPEMVVIDDRLFSQLEILPAVINRNLETDPSLEMVLLQHRHDESLLARAIKGGMDTVLLAQDPSLATRQLIHRLDKISINRNLISRDRATGLLNKVGFQKQARSVLSQAGSDRHMAMAVIDIDKFKNINDTWGHHFGDIVIKRLAVLLQVHMKQDDLLSRFGGEEFVMLLMDCNLEAAYLRLERMRLAFAGVLFEVEEEDWRGFTFSGGAAAYPALRSETELFRRADEMLYLAKQNGRNQIVAE
ncbi:GGDEF domain-containing protein [Burkholderiaceae bacterium DAT-1]|nr:GGDEF domain-containing protein [Burkholderiaceae bacterium DAT-1]